MLTSFFSCFLVMGFSFGNCQWNKYFYLWQTYIYSNKNDVILPSKEFSGVWKVWSVHDIHYEIKCTNGILGGLFRSYYSNGQVCSEGKMSDPSYGEIGDEPLKVYKKSDGQIEIFGVFNGIHRSYDRYGGLLKLAEGTDRGLSIIYSKSKNIDLMEELIGADGWKEELEDFEKELRDFESLRYP